MIKNIRSEVVGGEAGRFFLPPAQNFIKPTDEQVGKKFSEAERLEFNALGH